ncbi:MAG: metallophosphoesterase [Bryobacterales bacterium]
MRVQIFSDIHSDLAALERNAQVDADLYLCAGDLCNWGRGLDACGEILRPLGEKLWVMPGNHETAEQIADFCAKFGFRDFHGASFEQGGWHFAGLGYSSPTPFNTPGEFSEEELAAKLDAFAVLDPLVLVCHAPPASTALDRAGEGMHFGSKAVADFLGAHPPAHFFCGHIHEAAGHNVAIGPTQARNVGKSGYLLEL